MASTFLLYVTRELFWKEVDVLWDRADAVWEQARRVFAQADRMEKTSPQGQINNHRIRFSAKTWADRRRTGWKFIKMAWTMFRHGKADLRFHETPAKQASKN